jgi:hypothetical membrane protein
MEESAEGNYARRSPRRTCLKEADRMSARAAPRRASHKIGGALLFTAGAGILMGIITAEALYSAPYRTGSEISDLGASDSGVILQPSATIFDMTMIVTGLLIVAGACLVHRTFRRRAVTITAGLLGVGVLGVGVFPGNVHPQHPIFANLAFLAGGLAVLLSYKVATQPLRSIFVVLGATSLLSLALAMFMPEWTPMAELGLGGIERWIVYPIVLWLVTFGGYLMADRTAEEPAEAEGPSIPADLSTLNLPSAQVTPR